MENIVNGTKKKNFIVKTWERCQSIGKKSSTTPNSLFKSKSWHCRTRLPPSAAGAEKGGNNKKCSEGCFSVYVGPQKQRFVIKTEYANHPLFKTLLEDAELEYGYNSNGPIMLPCDVHMFTRVLAEMEDDGGDEDGRTGSPAGCGFAKGAYGTFNLLSPSRRSPCGGNMVKGYGSYRILSPSRLIKMNRW